MKKAVATQLPKTRSRTLAALSKWLGLGRRLAQQLSCGGAHQNIGGPQLFAPLDLALRLMLAH